MEKKLLYRIILVAVIVVVAGFALLPTFYYNYRAGKSELPGWYQRLPLSKSSLTLGLDLLGGMDLVISVNSREAVINELQHYKDLMQSAMRNDNIAYEQVQVDSAELELKIDFNDAEGMEKATGYIGKNYPELYIERGKDTLHPVYALRESAINTIERRAVDQVREVLTRRIDAFGLREPEIVVQGGQQVRLQLPGATDATRIKQGIVRTAKLEFMLVEDAGETREHAEELTNGQPRTDLALAVWNNPNPESAIKSVECYFSSGSKIREGEVPPHIRLVPGVNKPGSDEAGRCYALMEEVSVSGSDLKDARPGYDPDRMNASVVNFTFNLKGAQRFAEVTGENVGKLLAIVLEDQVQSAPVIKSRIFSSGQISGNFTPQEATDLANVLRSGALDVNIKIEEERSVGATLGADSIKQGEVAMFWGFLTVIIFMVIYYQGAGIIANVALMLNVVLVMAMLSLFGATLTLPGLAGIVLTVGMAVDANVLIFERIREELRTGKTPRAAMEAGYAKALWTILDANITTLVAALVLMQWGTGPIKGFAITLALGIISSLFTAIVVTRVIYDLLFTYGKSNSISIGIKARLAESK